MNSNSFIIVDCEWGPWNQGGTCKRCYKKVRHTYPRRIRDTIKEKYLKEVEGFYNKIGDEKDITQKQVFKFCKGEYVDHKACIKR